MTTACGLRSGVLRPTRRVTAEQLKQGYAEWNDGVIHHRAYIVVEELPDGTFVVLEPKPKGSKR